MIGGRSALLSAAGGGNPYGNWTGNYEDVSLLLRNGTPSGLLILLDESPTPNTITQFGNSSITTTVVKYGTSAMAFDGSGDYFQTSANAGLALGSGAFTIEAWVRPANTTAGYRGIVGDNVYNAANGFAFYQNGTAIEIWFGGSPATRVINATNCLTAGEYQHIAWARSSTGVNRLFVNGVQRGSDSTNSTNLTATTLRVGRVVSAPAGYDFNGYIDDLRITKGVARYESDFSSSLPAELPANATDDPHYSNVSLLLRNGTPVLIPLDESPTPNTITRVGDAFNTTTVVKYGTSAMAFDGNGDWFETNSTTDFDFANNPFTIEAWVYAITLNHVVSPAIFSNMNNGTSSSISGYVLAAYPTGELFFNDVNQSNIVFSLTSPAGTITTGQWYHVAICKAGADTNQVKLFVNGQIVASGTRNANIPVGVSGLPGRIGAWKYSVEQRPWNGYIDDLRITKGVARYTKNFLPPPAELPAI